LAVSAISIGNITLHYDPPEAGRFKARILVLPGLFQSLSCWRGVTAMLAHRGWEVYFLPRVPTGLGGAGAGQNVSADVNEDTGQDAGWAQALDTAEQAFARLGDNVVVFGADVGAALALSLLERVRPMAMALFAPTEPAALGARFADTLGIMGRRRFKAATGPVEAPASIVNQSTKAADLIVEPRAFIKDLRTAPPVAGPPVQPPTIVFAPGIDDLVATDHALEFAGGPAAKPSPTRLSGRWWPAVQGHNVADEVHRFVILTLSDRVVEFPDEILED
jgi:alpha-beta hydrolase superfamily lysophospholipase